MNSLSIYFSYRGVSWFARWAHVPEIVGSIPACNIGKRKKNLTENPFSR